MRVVNVTRQSCVVGSTTGIEVSSDTLFVESCSDATIFVTASFSTVTARALRRVTLVLAPCSESVTLDDCIDCVISVAAPRVTATAITSSVLFAAAKSPITVGSGSMDVRVGPYNVVGDGLLTATSLHEWIGPGETSCRLDGATEIGATRALAPADFYWRFLPVPQERPERLALSNSFAMLDAPGLPPAAESIFAGMRGSGAHRAEMLAQGKFVVSESGRDSEKTLTQKLTLTLTLTITQTTTLTITLPPPPSL